jgi:tetratricopeptide (TPR) repeat protein
MSTKVYAKENFFDEARNKYDEKELEDSKFLFQRNIVFNPQHAKSYLYLAKIYNSEENEKEEFKNLKTTLLLEPNNEEAMYMLIDIELKKSNFSEVKKLTKKFEIICSTFCDKTKSINERLKNIEAKDESKE